MINLYKFGRLPSGSSFLNYAVGLTTRYWAAAAAAAAQAISSNQQKKAAEKAADRQNALLREQTAESRADLAPYREFGARRMSDLENWLAGSQGAFAKPTAEEVRATPGYESRLGAIESSAAARGSLFSGDTLRGVGEFGASEYDRALQRKQNELAQRMQLANIGYGAAGGSAGLSQALGTGLSGVQAGLGAERGRAYSDVGGAVGGAIGQYEGQKRWNDFLNRSKSNKADNDDDYVSDIGWE